MTPVERLRAAIEKLETLKQRGYYEAHGWLVENVTVGPSHAPYEEQAPLTNDDLIVTLHRTIDAQISILRAALARAEVKIAGGGVEHAVWWHTRYPLELADAILGSDR